MLVEIAVKRVLKKLHVERYSKSEATPKTLKMWSHSPTRVCLFQLNYRNPQLYELKEESEISVTSYLED